MWLLKYYTSWRMMERKLYHVPFLTLLFCACGLDQAFSQGTSEQQDFISSQNPLPGIFHIAGAFTRRSSAGAEGARLAVKDINSYNNVNNVPLKIELLEDGETLCESGSAVALAKHLLSRAASVSSPFTLKGILAGCHQDCYLIANEVGPEYNALTFCYGQSEGTGGRYSHGSTGMNPFHQDTSNFPVSGLFLLSPWLHWVAYPLLKFIKHFEWRKVAVVSHDLGNGNLFGELADQFASILSTHGVQVGRFQGFGTGAAPQDYLDEINLHSYRIIFTFSEQVGARHILCQSYKKELYNSSYVWFYIGPTSIDWPQESNLASDGSSSRVGPIPVDVLPTDCTTDQLISAAQGHFTAGPVYWNPNEQSPTVSSKAPRTLRYELMQILEQSKEHLKSDFNEAPLAYDAVWAAYIGFATSYFKEGQEEGGDAHFDDFLSGIWFTGASGNVSFHNGKRSVRDANVKIEKYSNRRYEPVAWHFNSNNSLVLVNPSPFGRITPGDGSLPDDGILPHLPHLPPPAPDHPPFFTPIQPDPGRSLGSILSNVSIISWFLSSILLSLLSH